MNSYSEDVTCQFCLQSSDQMVDPKRLPCSHMFCKTCLLEDSAKRGIIMCPVCRQEYTENVDSLPAVMAEEADLVSVEKDTCTTCKDQIATGFCEKCSELACIQHLKVITIRLINSY